ncbi:MAG: hypothetical protein IJ326_03330 [Lachnospiraceae bacterium]|nr:hypothetical protein [Lachnospiraceae bacterium]
MKMKKILAVALVATMTMASCLTAFASGSGSGAAAGSSTSTTSSKTSSTVTSIAFEEVKAAGTVMNVAGVDVATTIEGAYGADTVAGMAVITPMETAIAALGLTDGQTPYVIAYDTDAKKSPLALEVVNFVANAIGAEVVTTLNIELGAKQNKMFRTLADGSIEMVIGIADADVTKTYSVICVQPGGVMTLLEDKDLVANTITIDVQAGLAAYAIIAK